MNLSLMRTNVRRDLKDEDPANYRWTNDQVDRAIARAVSELSQYCPLEMKSTLATTDGDKKLDISSLTSRVSVDKVEFPIDQSPRAFTRFELYGDILYLLETEGDGNNCYVYWTTLHTLDGSTSTIPTRYEDLVALGASAYAAISQGEYVTSAANFGGATADVDYKMWGEARLAQFQETLKKANRKIKYSKMIFEE
jgi:hypothetical protein